MAVVAEATTAEGINIRYYKKTWAATSCCGFFMPCAKTGLRRLIGMRRRKIHYLPGFISLLGLPVLLFFMRAEPVKRQTRLTMVVPSDDKQSYFSRYTVYEYMKKKKIIQVDLWDIQGWRIPNIKQEKKDFIVGEIQRLQFTHDTSTVLKVTLESANTYGDFVWLVNLAVVYDFKRYVLLDNAFFYIPSPRPEYLPPPEPDIKALDL